MKKLLFGALLIGLLFLLGSLTAPVVTGWLNYAQAKNYAMWTTKWLQADGEFYWKGDTIKKAKLVYTDLQADSMRMQRIGGAWSNWYYAGRGSYVLPTASATIKGGIKVGSGLSINPATGVLSSSGGDSYGFWQYAVNGSGVNNIGPGGYLDFVAGAGISLSPSGYHLTVNSTLHNQWDGGVTGLNAATGRTSLGLVIGTNVLAYRTFGSAANSAITDFAPATTVSFPGFGISGTTAAAGNDSRINNGQTAYGWGNHASLYVPIANDGKVMVSGSPSSAYLNNSQFYWGSASGLNYLNFEGATSGGTRPYSSGSAYSDLALKANLSGAAFTGAITCTSTITATNFIGTGSDSTLKREIQKLYSPDWVKKLQFVKFKMKADTSRMRYGVIAQELEKIAPDLVLTDDNGIKSVNYIDLLIAKNQHLQEQINFLKYENYCIIILVIGAFIFIFYRTRPKRTN